MEIIVKNFDENNKKDRSIKTTKKAVSKPKFEMLRIVQFAKLSSKNRSICVRTMFSRFLKKKSLSKCPRLKSFSGQKLNFQILTFLVFGASN